MILEPFWALFACDGRTNGRTDGRTEDRTSQAGPPSRCEFSAREGAPPPHSNKKGIAVRGPRRAGRARSAGARAAAPRAGAVSAFSAVLGSALCLPCLLPLDLCPNPLPAGATGDRSQLAHGLPARPAGRPGPPAGTCGQAGRAGRLGSYWVQKLDFHGSGDDILDQNAVHVSEIDLP